MGMVYHTQPSQSSAMEMEGWTLYEAFRHWQKFIWGESMHLTEEDYRTIGHTIFIVTSNHEWYGDTVLLNLSSWVLFRWRIVPACFNSSQACMDFRTGWRLWRLPHHPPCHWRRCQWSSIRDGSNLAGDGEFMLKHHLHPGISHRQFQAFLLVGQ